MSITIPSTTRTLIIKAGETGVLRSTARILSVGIIGNADAESNCVHVDEAISNAETYSCYEFAWEGDTREGSSGSWQTNEVTFEAIEIGNTSYPINVLINDMEALTQKIIDEIPSSIMKLKPAVNFEGFHYQDDNDKTRHTVCFLTLPSIVPELRAKLTGARIDEPGLPFPIYYVYARPLSYTGSDWCSCPTTATGGSS